MLKTVWTFAICLMLLGCGRQDADETFTPQNITVDDIGYYCNMVVKYHSGPKGQILLTGQDKAIWFTSVRDTIAFTMLPGEPKNIAAIYVTTMDDVDWEHPEQHIDAWAPAKSVMYVLNSAQRGGMGQLEAIPFKNRQTAEEFVKQHGGNIVSFTDIPEHYILGSTHLHPGET